MAKTAISTLITRIKRKADYSITDSDLSDFIVDEINDALKLIKQWLMDAGLNMSTSALASFETIGKQEYVDLENARITGNNSVFTAIAGDKITVTIDGTGYTTGALTGYTIVPEVISAINTAVGSTVASLSPSGYLVITSPTTGSTSSVVITNNTGNPATRLFQRVVKMTGNAATFSPVALDSLIVNIDGTEYAQLMAGLTTIPLIVSALNATIGSNVASTDANGFLVIESLTNTTSSIVAVRNSVGTPMARLFASAAAMSQSDISDLDEVISLTNRVNDYPLKELPYDELKALYPDPTAAYATTPDFFAKFGGRIYFGPTPSDNTLLYIDYIMQITEVTSSDTCPFNNKYDPLIKALCVKGLAEFLDPDNANKIGAANKNVEFWTKQLIMGASRNIGQSKGTASRKPEILYFSPRKVVN